MFTIYSVKSQLLAPDFNGSGVEEVCIICIIMNHSALLLIKINAETCRMLKLSTVSISDFWTDAISKVYNSFWFNQNYAV